MPSTPVATNVTRPSLTQRLLRLAGVTLVAGFALFCVVLLALRYFALPRLDAHRDAIAALLEREIGQPVEIDGIATGWDGWNPEITVRGLRVRDRARAGTLPLLELPSVTGVVAWTSLPLLELRFKELEIDGPRLAIRRDTAGRIRVAGIEIDPATSSGDAGAVDWLLRQRLIVVRNALVTWNDDLRNAPQLLLDRVQLRLESRFGRHRFGLEGTPPAEIASPIDVRGSFSARSLPDWQLANGELYVRLDYADLATWSEWLPVPVPIDSGKGALRMWSEFADGEVTRIVADLALADVQTRLRPGLPILDLARLDGRIMWNVDGSRRKLTTRELSFVARDGASPAAPLDLNLFYDVGEDQRTLKGEANANRLDLGPLAALAGQLPLPENWRRDLARYRPRGALVAARYEWKGPAEAPDEFRARGEVHDVGVEPVERTPGFSGLSGVVDASDSGGSIKIGSRNLQIGLPKLFARAIALDTASGDVSWERKGEAIAVRLADLEFANADAAGTASGRWQSAATGPGVIDLGARLTRGDVSRLPHYLPQTLGAGLRGWLGAAITQGNISDARLTLKGPLAEFPFAAGKGGQFVLAIKGQVSKFSYVEGWPPLTDIDADVRIEGTRLAVVATRGRSLGAALANVTAEIPDMATARPVLRVAGEASGPTAEFLAFIDQSPVAGWIDHVTDGIRASGNGQLKLRLDGSLGAQPSMHVSGDYQIVGNQVRVPGVPALSALQGALSFTDKELRARDMTFEAVGGPARLAIVSADGRIGISASGTAKLATLRNEYSSHLLERVSGTTDWQLTVDASPAFASWVLESSLRGAVLDLPAPLGKGGEAAVPTRIERRALAGTPQRDEIRVEYGKVARLIAQRRLSSAEPVVDRALLELGRAMDRPGEPDRAGLAIRGDLPALNADDWLFIAQDSARRDSTGAASLPLNSIDLQVGELDAFGRGFHDMTLSARRGGSEWRLTLYSREIDGTAAWEPPNARFASGRVSARLAHLSVPGAGELKAWSGTPATVPRSEGAPNPWPELELVADQYIGRRGNIGRLDLVAKPQGNDWRIEKLAVTNDAGAINADGWWRTRGKEGQTRLDVAIDVKDSGAFLARYGLPDAVKGAPTRIDGQVGWNGAPTDFDYPTLSGNFRINVGAGQFTRIEPGIGKLIGVLSLQALPRRITLDFRDIFSEGFAFDAIAGEVRIANGVLRTDNLLLNGPAARVNIAGDVDLEHETQRLSVRVQPSLATSVSAGAGAAAILLLAANPIIGAAVGAGTLLAQKIMKDPIEQMFSYEYLVRGSWAEPLVERVSGRRLETAAEPAVAPGGAGGATAAKQ